MTDAVTAQIIDGLSPKAIADCIDALRYLRRYSRLDAADMAHVNKALDRVDIEQSFARHARFRADQAHAIRIAAE